MSKLTFPILLTLLVIWLVSATWWFNKKYNQVSSSDNTECSIPFTLQDGNFQTKAEKSFFFEKSDWEPTIPLQTLNSFKSVALHLANNKNKKLTLRGWFGLDEVNNSDFANNGFARAETIKNELVNFGAPESNIDILSDSIENMELKCGKILRGVDFEFADITQKINTSNSSDPQDHHSTQKEKESRTESSDDVSTVSIFDPKKTYVIFYEENTYKPKVNEEIDAYFQDLEKHLQQNPKDRLLLVGHTDLSGDPKKHFNFGKYRARKLRDVILEYGVAKKRIKTDSEGSSKPLGSNNSKEGRYQNRRVEISIIQR